MSAVKAVPKTDASRGKERVPFLHDYISQTREAWLARVAQLMAPKFESVNAGLPPKLRVSISLMKKAKAVGVCYDHSASADKTTEILIRIDQADAMTVAAILAHELIHAAIGNEEKHGPAFKRVALAIGLEGRMTATVAGETFKGWANAVLHKAGPFPHAALDFNGSKSGPKKQGTRLVKAQCSECEYTVRVTRQWLAMGAPLCVCNKKPMSYELPDEDGDNDE